MGTPGFRDWWEKRGTWFSDEFREHIQKTLKTLPDYERWPTDSDGLPLIHNSVRSPLDPNWH